MLALEIENLNYTYPTAEQPALRNLALQISSGELLALIGPNQAGKSSLCYALAGVVPHFFQGEFNGLVRVNGMNTLEHGLGELARQVGLVLQNPAHQLSGVRYTVFEEAAFGLENLGIPRDEMQARVDQALEVTGLAGLAGRSPYQLSGGQQQRLALAGILAVSPPILVLDEPDTFLDPQGVQHIFEILANLKRQGKTVIVASHKLAWIAQAADRVVALAGGEIVLDGPPREVLIAPQIRQIGLDWTRYTQAADLARQSGLWPEGHPLPVTFEETAAGFSAAQEAG